MITAVAADQFTPREAEVAGLVAEDLMNKEIAQRLCLSEHTVKSYVENCLSKRHFHSRVQLARSVWESQHLRPWDGS